MSSGLRDNGRHRRYTFSLGQKAWLRALEETAPLENNPERIFPVLLGELSARFGNSPALISERETFTFQDLAERANQYARWTHEQGLAPGASVGLMMHNRPDYLAIWGGITRMGSVVALLNTNLKGSSLAHCIDVASVSHIVVSDELCPILAEALPFCRRKPEVWVHGSPHGGFCSISRQLDGLLGSPLHKGERRAVTLADRALCIFTSGTTGFPKAANVSHRRIMSWSHWFAGMMDIQASDRLYNCLPFYHSMGGVAATGALLVKGGSVLIREKFSARRFWEDIRKHECTIFQYIGELCRYLLKSSPSHDERDHHLRLCCGNGLGGDIWHEFKGRFRIPHILEFYAATEANFSLYNVDEEPGSIGRIPAFLGHRFPIKLIEIDSETIMPLRDGDGFCVACGANETGEAVFPIAKRDGAGAASFEGYTNAEDSSRKVLRDVMARGDQWFRSGDLMRRDERGYFYFADRVGETFRWKGENVSASEVMHVISACPGVSEAMVYAVAVPAADGRAGMAAISVDDGFELAALKAHLDFRLPRYAQPLFLRIVKSLELTATYKPKKSDFASQGYDPESVSDPLYLNDHERATFVELIPSLYQAIVTNRIRL
jgi:fatty-acyl-CoA synthase